MKELLVLGLDGLEYDKVMELDLKTLKQAEFGKLEVPIHKVSQQPLTPQVWYAFLTGKVKDIDFVHKSKSISLLRWLRARVPISLGLGKVVAKHVDTTGYLPELKEKTFIETHGIEQINAPYYDEDFVESQKNGAKWLNGEMSEDEFKGTIESKYAEVKQKIASNKANKLFAYIKIFDTAQHCFYTDADYINKLYRDVDSFVSMAAKGYSKCLILSDHGLKGGEHTNYGFYSCSETTGLKEPSVVDLHYYVTGEPNKEEIKKRLQGLGYM
ncbi:hypothetical protein ACFLQ2_04610 [archaeon]